MNSSGVCSVDYDKCRVSMNEDGTEVSEMSPEFLRCASEDSSEVSFNYEDLSAKYSSILLDHCDCYSTAKRRSSIASCDGGCYERLASSSTSVLDSDEELATCLDNQLLHDNYCSPHAHAHAQYPAPTVAPPNTPQQDGETKCCALGEQHGRREIECGCSSSWVYDRRQKRNDITRPYQINKACASLRQLVPGVDCCADKVTVLESTVSYLAYLKRFVDGKNVDEKYAKFCEKQKKLIAIDEDQE